MEKATFLEQWQGKVIIKGEIEAVTGLRIGGSDAGLKIGGIDNPIIRAQPSGRPYIPGSSLKGKMRSLVERALGKKLIEVIRGRIWQHQCKEERELCAVCKVFGVPGEATNSEPTRLIVRDGHLLKDLYVTEIDGGRNKRQWDAAAVRTDLPFSETKIEVTIDRITAAAVPRTIERVPAGALFDYSLVFDIFEESDRDHLRLVFEGMQLLEDDYLGGLGSRGCGQIRFNKVEILWRPKEAYASGAPATALTEALTLTDIAERFDTEIKAKLHEVS